MILLLLAILPMDRACISEDYVLQVGDRIAISIIGTLNYTYNQTISPQGNIFIQSRTSPSYIYSEIPATKEKEEISTVPVIEVMDILHVAGLSVKEASEILEECFKRYFKNIEVELNVIMFTDKVYVSGAVTAPQAYPFLPNRTIQEYIALAGGPLESADLENVKVERRESQNIVGELNLIVQRGDIITVPQAFVYVSGAVTTPNAYPLLTNRTVQEYIALAGGPLESGNLDNVKVERCTGDTVMGNLYLIVESGDIITVPQNFVYVRGQVEDPGAFPFNPNFSAEEYIGMAGGPTSRANLNKSFVIKRDGTRKPLRKATIEKGDTIVIREIVLKWWEDYITIASPIISVISVISTVIIVWLTSK